MFLTPADLAPFADIDEAKAAAMIEDVEARAAQAAPCITTPEFLADEPRTGAVRAILRQAVLRWNDAGTGVFTQLGAGPYQASSDNRQERKALLWPSEISDLRDICASFSGDTAAGAFELDTLPAHRAPEPPLGITMVSRVSGATYYSSDLGYLDTP